MEQQLSRHAALRAQQRGIGPAARELLLAYGDCLYDGHGGLIRFFSGRSLQRVEGDLGGDTLRRLGPVRRCYLVESASDGTIITLGKRHKGRRLRRP
jgi:hypothetical protein